MLLLASRSRVTMNVVLPPPPRYRDSLHAPLQWECCFLEPKNSGDIHVVRPRSRGTWAISSTRRTGFPKVESEFYLASILQHLARNMRCADKLTPTDYAVPCTRNERREFKIGIDLQGFIWLLL